MRFGVLTPVVIRSPGRFRAWESAAGVDELVTVARAADRLGYHHLTCSEHVAVPAVDAELRGGTYWDPLATLSYLAAHTSHIGLATHVLVLGYHHPLGSAGDRQGQGCRSAGHLAVGHRGVLRRRS